MIQNLTRYSFLILLTSLFLSLTFIYSMEDGPQVNIAAGISVISSFFILWLHNFNQIKLIGYMKWINFLSLIIYIVMTFLFVLIFLYASPDAFIYPTQSAIFLASSGVSLGVLFINLKNQETISKQIVFFIIFFSLIYLYKGISLIYTYAPHDEIARPLCTAIGFFGMSIFMFLYLRNIKYVNSLIIKLLYIATASWFIINNLALISDFEFIYGYITVSFNRFICN